jgi:hypothetical protein
MRLLPDKPPIGLVTLLTVGAGAWCLQGFNPVSWWGYQDLNLGPLPYQGSALTD